MFEFLAVAALAASAPAPPHTDAAATTMAMFAAFNRHDAAAMAALYAADARLTSPDYCAPRGKADVERSYAALFAAFPDVEDVIEMMVVEDDKVAVRFTATSKATGLRLPIAAFLKVRDGLIVSDDSYFDAGGKACEA